MTSLLSQAFISIERMIHEDLMKVSSLSCITKPKYLEAKLGLHQLTAALGL